MSVVVVVGALMMSSMWNVNCVSQTGRRHQNHDTIPITFCDEPTRITEAQSEFGHSWQHRCYIVFITTTDDNILSLFPNHV